MPYEQSYDNGVSEHMTGLPRDSRPTRIIVVTVQLLGNPHTAASNSLPHTSKPVWTSAVLSVYCGLRPQK